MYTVEDNFLEKEDYLALKELLESEDIGWFFAQHQTTDKKNDCFYFYHLLYTDNKPNSPFFDAVNELLLRKMNIKALINVRVNLATNMHGMGATPPHIDEFTPDNSHKTSVFYIGTNNGKTVMYLDDTVEVHTVGNRLLTFDANTLHSVTHHTDGDRRIVININYY
jgi:hypothetical protein